MKNTKNTVKLAYTVFGWHNGCDFDAGKPADCVAVILATSESEAEHKANKGFKRDVGGCDVVCVQAR